MIWEPFVLALVLGLIVSAGLYFAYLWPQVEPLDDQAGPEVVSTGAEPPSPREREIEREREIDEPATVDERGATT